MGKEESKTVNGEDEMIRNPCGSAGQFTRRSQWDILVEKSSSQVPSSLGNQRRYPWVGGEGLGGRGAEL